MNFYVTALWENGSETRSYVTSVNDKNILVNTLKPLKDVKKIYYYKTTKKERIGNIIVAKE